jgi:deoxyadenosine/deoxycytidine kinase
VSAPLFSVIGPPAVGKTTLAEFLMNDLPAEIIREDYAGNPFLAQAYAGVAEARLPSQLYFLMSRVGQLSLASWPASGRFVSDYGFCQDRLFARTTLHGDDLRAYEKIAGRLEGLVRKPDVLIHLDASESTLLERIARRGRDFEKAITAAFLAHMRESYAEAALAAECPVFRVDCEITDLREVVQRSGLLNELKKMLG